MQPPGKGWEGATAHMLRTTTLCPLHMPGGLGIYLSRENKEKDQPRKRGQRLKTRGEDSGDAYDCSPASCPALP